MIYISSLNNPLDYPEDVIQCDTEQSLYVFDVLKKKGEWRRMAKGKKPADFQLNLRIEALETANSDLIQEIDDLRGAYSLIRDNLAARTSEVNALRGEIASLKNHRDGLLEDIEAFEDYTDPRIEELQAQIGKIAEENLFLSHTNLKLKKVLTAMVGEL